MPPTRWGILSTGKIAQDFVRALNIGDPGHERHEVVAVAARNVESVRKFIDDLSLSKSTAACTYDQLYALPNIDIIYVSPINRNHKSVTLNALNAGRNVLCEKPMGVNGAEVREMNELAKKKGVFLMEGYWSSFYPGQQEMKRLVQTKVGEIKCMQISFCNEYPTDGLLDTQGGGGALYMMGYYMIALAVYLTGPDSQVADITAVATLDAENTADETLQFSLKLNDTLVNGITSSQLSSHNEALIIGENGAIRLPNYFCTPLEIETYKPRVVKRTVIDGLDDANFNYNNSAAFIFEADHVRECLLAGNKECAVWTAEHAQITADIMEAIRKEAGIVFPQDK